MGNVTRLWYSLVELFGTGGRTATSEKIEMAAVFMRWTSPLSRRDTSTTAPPSFYL